MDSTCQDGQVKTSYYLRIRKRVMMLIEHYETGDVKWRKVAPHDALTTQRFLNTVNHYSDHLIRRGYSQGTIGIRKKVFVSF